MRKSSVVRKKLRKIKSVWPHKKVSKFKQSKLLVLPNLNLSL